jgi:tRNA(Ile)-lysidine synthase
VLQPFLNLIQKEKLFDSTEKVLLTVSGGIDSIAMCELFHKAKLKFGIAHCNFQLRAKESDADEAFVEALSEKYNVSFHSIKFNTSAFAKKNKLSIQVAARQLRYQWFEEIREQYAYNYIATAHHQNDSIETFFINLIRGTGISGLHGILPKQGNIIRPLLFATKTEIESFTTKHKLNYREDSSNASDKYLRNKIRHHLIPLLNEFNPSAENAINKSIEHLREVEHIYKNVIEQKRKKIVITKNNSISISIKSLKKLQPINAYLYEFLKPFDFNSATAEEISIALNGESGKQFFSPTHRLIKDREFLIIKQVKSTQDATIHKHQEASGQMLFSISKKQTQIDTADLKLTFKSKILNSNSQIPNPKSQILNSNSQILNPKSQIPNPKSQILNSNSQILNPKSQIPNPKSSAFLDFDKLEFPLEIRKWRPGDIFYPLGMKGKKKLSDFLINNKVSLLQKENTWLLASAGQIAWVIGMRIDDRFKITPKTKRIYLVELI